MFKSSWSSMIALVARNRKVATPMIIPITPEPILSALAISLQGQRQSDRRQDRRAARRSRLEPPHAQTLGRRLRSRRATLGIRAGLPRNQFRALVYRVLF